MTRIPDPPSQGPDRLDFERRAQRLLGPRWLSAFSRGSGIHYSTLKRWKNGDLPVPPYAASLLDLLDAVPRAFWPERWARAVAKRRSGPPPGRSHPAAAAAAEPGTPVRVA